MSQKKNLRFRIFHDSHNHHPFSRIELGKSVFLIDTNASICVSRIMVSGAYEKIKPRKAATIPILMFTALLTSKAKNSALHIPSNEAGVHGVNIQN